MVQPYQHTGFPKPGPQTPQTGNVAQVTHGPGTPFKGTNLGGNIFTRLFTGAFRR